MSISFDFPKELRDSIINQHREFQLAVALYANKNRNDKYLGIGKYEGGVRVWVKENEENSCKEICIHRDYVMDDWDRYNNNEKPAEQAVVDAIHYVRDQLQNNINWLDQYTPMLDEYYLSDPLSSFFLNKIKRF